MCHFSLLKRHKKIITQKNLNHKDAEVILQEYREILQKKSDNFYIKLDMNVFVNRANDFRKIMKMQKKKK